MTPKLVEQGGDRRRAETPTPTEAVPLRRASAWTARLLLVAGLALSGATSVSAGNDTEAGLPVLTSARGRDLARGGSHVDPQMFAFAQDSRGVLYVANGAGVLVFDGARWESVEAGGGATVLSLAVADDDTVYLGTAGGFGRLVSTPQGTRAYEAFDRELPPGDQVVGDVWDTILLDGAIYFRSPERLYRWRRGALDALRPAGRLFGVARKIGDRLFVRDTDAGLYVIDDEGELRLAPDGDLLADLSFSVLLPLTEERLLVGTRSQGLFSYDAAAETPRERRLERFATGADALLAEQQVYSGAALPGGGWVLGTLRAGAVLVDPQGQIGWHIGRQQGLTDDTVLAAFADRSGNVWLGLNDGLTLVETGAGLTHHGEATGLVGFVEAVERSQGRIYAATGIGVLRLDSEAIVYGQRSLLLVPGLATQAWALRDTGEVLLAGTEQGVFEVRGLESRRLLEGETYALAAGARADRVWAGRVDGVAWLEPRPDGGWSSGRVAGVDAVVRYLVERPEGTLWLVTEYGDLLRVDLPGFGAIGDGVPPRVRTYGAAEGLPDQVARTMTLGDDLLVGSRGIHRWDPDLDRFQPDPRFPLDLVAEHGVSLCPLTDGSLVLSAGHRSRHLVARQERFEPLPSVVERVPLGNRLISCLVEGDVVWLGTDDGLFRWDRAWRPPRTADLEVQLRRVRRGDLQRVAARVDTGRAILPPLPWTREPMRFELALPSFVAAERNEYRTRLEGFEADWTPWTREAWREFTNLPPGRYLLRVQGRDVRGEQASETALAFEITPPWYRSTPAYLGYAGLAAAAFVFGGRLQVRTVRRRNLELQSLVDERTEELHAASITDPLTGLHNRRFFAEVIPAEVAAATRAHRAEPGGATQLVFCLIDLDDFKAVNDRFGHAGGDDILRQVADRLRDASREGDLLFRWGGEELLLLARRTRRDGTADLARRLLEAIGGTPFAIRSRGAAREEDSDSRVPHWRLTASIGFTALPFFGDAPHETTLDDLLHFADAALYEAKRSGRNRACGAQPGVSFAHVSEGWPGWRRQSLGEAAASWLTLIRVDGPQAVAPPGDHGAT